MKKNILISIILVIAVFIYTTEVNAATGSLGISASVNTAKVGQTVKATIYIKGLTGRFNVTSSNPAVLSGGCMNVWYENDGDSCSFSAKGVGSATITVTAISVNHNDDYSEFTGSKSVSINIVDSSSSNSGGTTNNNSTTKEVKEYSSDNALASLSVDGYDIEPKFNKDTLEYKLFVDEKVESIKINAKAKDSKAEVKGTGDVKLSPGENTLEIKVIAENGNEKVYKLIVMVEDKNPIHVKIDNKEYTVVKKNNNLIDKLDGYEEITIKIDNQDVVAYKNKKTNVTLVILKDSDNKLGYYVYNDNEKSYKKYRFITIGNVVLQLLDANEVMDHYNKYKITIQNEDIDIYKIKKNYKVGLIYGTNIKTGNTGFYVYDENENTLSKYNEEEFLLYKKDIKKLKSYLMIVLGSVSLIAIVIIIISLVKSKKRKFS